jgi:hypothetical protein
MGFGVVGGRAARRLVRESGGVTFGLAALTTTGAVFAGDSLDTHISGDVVATQGAGSKIKQVGRWTVLAAGVAVVDGRTVLDEVAAAVTDAPDLRVAVPAAMAAAESVCDPLRPHRPRYFGPNEVIWDVVLAVTEGDSNPRYARLVSSLGVDGPEVHAHELVPKPDRVMAVVLGAPHPALRLLDWEYGRDYDDLAQSAELTRRPAPTPPQQLPTGNVEAAVLAALEAAIATEQQARRPSNWPAGTPVAAYPVQHTIIGRVT